MSEFREGRVQCLSSAGLHEMAYVEWGAADNPDVVLCVHGLTRCGRDFDDLARALCDRYRVVCPDVVGRGNSGRLRDPRLYGVPQYCADMVTLLARVQATTLQWVGTSMGGLIGMALAAQAQTPIQSLVLNDVGPVVTAASLARIGEYVGKVLRFDSMEQAEALVRFVSRSFGPLTDAQWRHLTEHAVRRAADGKFEFRYDPGIAVAFSEAAAAGGGKDIDLWPVYDAVRCPTLVLRGAESDLLTAQTAREMTERGPHARLIEFAGIGHAPALMAADQVAAIRAFLVAPKA
jgi:pimeloyl-ACP methyl ester carboxylesterase